MTARQPQSIRYAASRTLRVNTARPSRRYRSSTIRPRQHGAEPGAHRSRWRFRAGIAILLIGTIGGHTIVVKHAAAQNVITQQHVQQQADTAARNEMIFQRKVNALIAVNPYVDYSVSIIDTAGNKYNYGADIVYDGASTAKLLTAADYLHHVDLRRSSLDEKIAGHSARYWLKSMLVDSDDIAWNNLNAYLTHADLATYAQGVGIQDYDVDNNRYKSADIAMLLHKLYTTSLISDSNRAVLLDYMNQANYRGYITAAVPAKYQVYHKIGMDADNVHDAAIISNGQSTITIVIFTNGHGTYDWPERANAMQSITKDALAAFLPTN